MILEIILIKANEIDINKAVIKFLIFQINKITKKKNKKIISKIQIL